MSKTLLRHGAASTVLLDASAASAAPSAGTTAAEAPVLPGTLLAARGLVKSYHKSRVDIPVLRQVDLDVQRGEFVSIVGQSGSGKSTLLHLLGLLDAPDTGSIWFDGARADSLPIRQRDRLRNQRLGMIFQFYHLLPELSMLENVLAPLMIRQSTWRYLRERRQHIARAQELLELVGLAHRVGHRPRELSGGEMQRTAIARALVNRPDLLLADEPTGNLDQETGREIIELLRSLNRREGLTIVMITHDPLIARQADRTVEMVAGQLVGGQLADEARHMPTRPHDQADAA